MYTWTLVDRANNNIKRADLATAACEDPIEATKLLAKEMQNGDDVFTWITCGCTIIQIQPCDDLENARTWGISPV